MPTAGGAPAQCFGSNEQGQVDQESKYQLGIGFSNLNSTLRFDDKAKSEFDIKMNTVAVSGGIPLNTHWALHLALGMILNGRLKPDTGTDFDIKPGGFVSVGFEYAAVTGGEYKPYIDLSLVLGGSMAETEDPDNNKIKYISTDLRIGARSSWNISNRLFPYAAVRVFGGPVMWKIDGKDVTGSDIYHYLITIGGAVKLGPTVLSLEWAGLGEQSLKAGVSIGL